MNWSTDRLKYTNCVTCDWCEADDHEEASDGGHGGEADGEVRSGHELPGGGQHRGHGLGQVL